MRLIVDKKIVFLFVLFVFFIGMMHVSSAGPSLNATIEGTQGITFIPGNDTATFTLNITVLNFGTINASIPNVTLYMPYGILNNTAAGCNGPGGYWEINKTTVACNMSISNLQNGVSNVTQLVVKSRIFSFNNYTRLPFTVNAYCNNCTGLNSTNTTFIVAQNFWKNPRPRIDLDYATSPTTNSTFFIDGWGQSRPYYEVWLPIFTYNSTSNRPEPANNSYAEIIYADKSFIENPSYFELYSYAFNFTIVFNSTNTALGQENVTYVVSTPGYNTTLQSLRPLSIQTFNFTTIDNQNKTQTIAVPAPTGFTVYYNNTAFTDTSLFSLFRINITYNTAHGSSTAPDALKNKLLEITVPSTVGKYLNFSIRFTLVTISGSSGTSVSPLFVLNQVIGGFNPAAGDAPPAPGDNITMAFRTDLRNYLENFTLNELRIRFLTPINVTTNSSTFNMSSNDKVSWYNGSFWNETLGNGIITRGLSCSSIMDFMSESPTKGNNITICFNAYDFNLSTSFFNYWDPNNRTNATINSTATMQFPVLNESDSTPDTAGSTNRYNSTISMSQQGKLNLSAKISGLDSSDTINSVIVDGQTLTSSNYTQGSFLVNSLGQGTHTISVTYTTASSSSSSSSSSGSSTTTTTVSNIKSKVFTRINPGIAAEWNVEHTNITGVKKIIITVNNQANAVKLTLGKASIGSDMAKAENFEIFQYFEITTTNLQGKLKDGAIIFEVPKKWLTKNNREKESIFLLHYTGNSWEKLNTVEIGETPDSYQYSATTTAFSFFAIGSETKVEQPEEQIKGTEEVVDEEPPLEQQTEKKPFFVYLFIILVVLFAISFIGYKVIHQKKSTK